MKNEEKIPTPKYNSKILGVGNCKKLHKRYEFTVKIFQSLVELFRNNPNLIDVYSTGKSLKYRDGYGEEHIITPDLITLYDDKQRGLLIEVKYDLSGQRETLTGKISKLSRYLNKLYGWEEVFQKIGVKDDDIISHDVILLCHSDDAGIIKEQIQQLIRDDIHAYKHLQQGNLCIWSVSEELNKEGNEVMRFKCIWGDINHKELNNKAKNNIDIPAETFIATRTEILFVSDQIPTSYIIYNIMKFVKHRVLAAESFYRDKLKREGIPISYEEICEMFTRYYGPISEHSTAQIKYKEIKDALDDLCEIGYNFSKLGVDEVKKRGLNTSQKWFLYTLKTPRGDMVEWICKKLEELEIKREEIRKKSKEKAKSRSIDEWF